jgi:hypothetical protein
MFSGLNWLARVQRLEPVNATLTGQSTCLFNGFANNFGEVTIDRLTLRTRKLGHRAENGVTGNWRAIWLVRQTVE